MTTPKVGDIVWFNHGIHETVMVSDQPLVAIVTYVHAVAKEGHPVRVNLAVFGKNGDQWQKHSVVLWDGEGDHPEDRLAFAYAAGTDLTSKPVEPQVAPVIQADPPLNKPIAPSSEPVTDDPYAAD